MIRCHLNHAGPGKFTRHKVAKRLHGQAISCLRRGKRQRQPPPLLADSGAGRLKIKIGRREDDLQQQADPIGIEPCSRTVTPAIPGDDRPAAPGPRSGAS
jgi:hypothetical protein